MLAMLLCLLVNPFDRLMTDLMRKYEIPAASLAIAKDGDLFLARGYAVAPDALFRIASVSKPITAVAVMQLVECGKLKLDERAFRLLKLDDPADGRVPAITVRELLEHTGGWDRGKSPDPMFRPEATSPLAIIRHMLGQELDFDPGTKHVYSNFGYCVLGRVIEKVSGLSYEEYVKRNVLAPLGIVRMRIGGRSREERAPGEVEYADSAYRLKPDVMDAHGGWIASAADLVKFAEGVPRLLKPETIRVMTARPRLDFWKDRTGWYALGWQVTPKGDGRISMSHSGSMPGTAALLVRGADGYTWAALFNKMPPVTSPFTKDLDRGMGEAVSAFSASGKRQAPDRLPEARPAP